jgi:RiboL-PSP-HEPN
MPSDPVATFVENTDEVKQLVALHKEKTGSDRGRRFGVEILNKSGIVLLTACWEAFVEDCASVALEFVLQNTPDPTMLPKVVRTRIGQSIKDDNNVIKAWELASSGWQNVLRNYKQQLLHTYVSFFNTPKAGNVDDLFAALLGLDRVSNNWSWQRLTSQGARDRLANYIELRGSIAHRVRASQAVHKKAVNDYADFITGLAVRTANVTRTHVHSLVKAYPWDKYTWGTFE